MTVKTLPCLVEELKDHIIGDIATGSDHCLAVTQDGQKLYSWGQGKFGALGTSKSQNLLRP
jgi:alpha-tubulin suppressor-like RCC1 family protein